MANKAYVTSEKHIFRTGGHRGRRWPKPPTSSAWKECPRDIPHSDIVPPPSPSRSPRGGYHEGITRVSRVSSVAYTVQGIEAIGYSLYRTGYQGYPINGQKTGGWSFHHYKTRGWSFHLYNL